MKSNMGFEESIKQVLEGYTVPYNSADWTELEKNLDSSSKKGNLSSALFYGILLTAALTFTAVLWYSGSGENAIDGEGQLSSSDKVVDQSTYPSGQNENTIVPPTFDGNNGNNGNIDSSDGEVVDLKNTENNSIANINADLNDANGQRQLKSSSAYLDSESRDDPQNKMDGVERDSDLDKLDKAITNIQSTNKTGSPGSADLAKSNNNDKSIRPNNDDQIMAVGFSSNVAEGCPGSSIDFNVVEMPENGIYLWNFGDGSFSNKPNPEHQFDKPGNYEVTLSITSLDDGSIRSEPARDLIVIHDAPYADFSWEKRAVSNEIPVIQFENTSQSGIRWQWDLGDGNGSFESHPKHVYKKKGSYQVTLTTINPMGCIDKVSRLVEVANDYKLLAPNTFSPNGDGTNDVFIPEALKILDINFKMSIFEPNTGRLIYETIDVNAPWNGRSNNKGAACEKGEYVWVIDVIDGFNAQESYNGKVTLLR